MSSILNLSVQQLLQAADIKEKIAASEFYFRRYHSWAGGREADCGNDRQDRTTDTTSRRVVSLWI
jgi:hypothetical protein